MIWASYYIRNRRDNRSPQGNCVKRNIGQIIVLVNATDDLVNYLLENIFLWIFIWINVGLTEKSLRNGMKFLLNLDPLSKTAFCDLGYLDRHTSLNTLDILAEDWSIIGTSAISEHSVARSIKFMHNSWSSFVSTLFSVCLTFDSICYGPIRSSHTTWHVVKVSESLSGSNPYLALCF